MDLSFLAVGRLKGPEQELCDRYLKRLNGVGRQLGFGKSTLVTINEGRGNSTPARQKQESDALLKKVSNKAILVALDERGDLLDSRNFSIDIADIRDRGASELVFVLGGPDGHGETLLHRADEKISLSPMTMPHGLARAVLFEQVYRALTILGNHPYHRE